MATKSTNLEKYLDAVRTLKALERAALDEPKVDRERVLKQARTNVLERLRPLTGGQIGQAKRILDAAAASGSAIKEA